MAAMLDFIGANKDKDGNEVEIVPYQDGFKALINPNLLAHSQPLPDAFKEKLEPFINLTQISYMLSLLPSTVPLRGQKSSYNDSFC